MKAFFLAGALLVVLEAGFAQEVEPRQGLSEESKACLACHGDINTPLYSIYGQWERSPHYNAEVGCFECHKARKEDEDSYLHEGYTISLIVSPKDCEPCHEKEVEQFSQSRHAATYANRIRDPRGSFIRMISDQEFYNPEFPSQHALTGGVTGCFQCHGSQVQVKRVSDEEVILDASAWPNEGIGRVNPDGSRGSCVACHDRHEFSIAQARQPESCGHCHTWGSDIPMIDIYKASKHGKSYYTNKETMNLDSQEWSMGKQYVAGPTCASCHMSESPSTPVTHNVSLRFNWGELGERAQKSLYSPPSSGSDLEPRPVDDEQTMKAVCKNCHSEDLIDGYYIQYMAVKRLAHEKYRIPGAKLYGLAQKVLSAMEGGEYARFTHAIDFIWFNEGGLGVSRAIAAAAKPSPDYTYTSNLYLATNWFKDFVPELRKIISSGLNSEEAEAREAAQELEKELGNILSNPIY